MRIVVPNTEAGTDEGGRTSGDMSGGAGSRKSRRDRNGIRTTTVSALKISAPTGQPALRRLSADKPKRFERPPVGIRAAQ
jgi:hypothetical protein